MAEVRVKNVSKFFGKVVAVKDFTLDIKDGEFIILVGPSGYGDPAGRCTSTSFMIIRLTSMWPGLLGSLP